jgi:predicted nuclease of restriction endonuclease-like (RecB) superfamily
MTNIKLNKEYANWLNEVKSKIRSAQIKTALAANRELILFYWELGRDIFEKQKNAKWGAKLLEQLSTDLKAEFSDIQGLSKTNLKYCSRFYQFYSISQQPVDQSQSKELPTIEDSKKLSQQLVDQIPWGHNIQIFTKVKNVEEAQFYIQQTIENGWSRDVLALQLKSDSYPNMRAS